MSYNSKHTGAVIDQQIGRVIDGSVVVDNTLSALDENSNKPVSGKGIASAITQATDRIDDQLAQLEQKVLNVNFTKDDLSVGNLVATPVGGTASVGALSTYHYNIFDVSEGDTYKITTTGGDNTARGYCFLDDNNAILFSSDGGVLTDEKITIPNGVTKLGVNCESSSLDRFSLIKRGVNYRINENANNINLLQDKLLELDKHYYEIITMDINDLDVGFVGVTNNKILPPNPSFPEWRSKIIPCREGQTFFLHTEARGNTAYTYRFADENYNVVASGDQYTYSGNIITPAGASYIAINANTSIFDPNTFIFKTIIVNENIIQSKIDSELRDIYLTKDDLWVGNLVATPVGDTVSIGSLTTYYYNIFNVVEGEIYEITTIGGANTARGYCFLDKNNVILYSSDGGALTNKKFTIPQGVTKLGVNCETSFLDSFSLIKCGVNYRINENTNNISELQKNNLQPKKHIPLFYGKDIFMIKNNPLKIYAKNVLMSNYPSYNGIYVNKGEIVAAGKNYDFNEPQINAIIPEGNIYFEDGASVDIYANHSTLYKDEWNVVRGISVHNTDVSNKSNSIKVMCIGSSTTEIGMATYVKKYLETLGVTMIGCGSKNDYLGTKSEGYYGWSCAQLCGAVQNAEEYPQTGLTATNPFMKLATSEDKVNYPNYCFTYVEGGIGTRESYADATDKNQDFYIFDFAWYLQTRQVETPDVIFFLLGLNDSVKSYNVYMRWIVDRIIQACPNTYIGINVSQAIRLESAANDKIAETEAKFNNLYKYVEEKNYNKMKIVSIHAHNSPDFSHDFTYSDGENNMTEVATPNGGYLHMNSNGYLECAKSIGAFVAYCIPNK